MPSLTRELPTSQDLSRSRHTSHLSQIPFMLFPRPIYRKLHVQAVLEPFKAHQSRSTPVLEDDEHGYARTSQPTRSNDYLSNSIDV
jgi:hypothetical protein